LDWIGSIARLIAHLLEAMLQGLHAMKQGQPTCTIAVLLMLLLVGQCSPGVLFVDEEFVGEFDAIFEQLPG
jgi:hypothetical protein